MWGSLSDRFLRARTGRLHRVLAAAGLGTGLACGFGAPASAQVAPEYYYLPDLFGEEIPRGETVRNRPRPELDALGLHLGGFYVFPSLTNGISYNDNVFAADNNEEGDFLYTLEPQVAVRSDWNRHAVGLAAGGRLGYYFDETGVPLPLPDAGTFTAWDDGDLTRRIVARTAIGPGVSVSTLCLGAERLGDVDRVAGEPRLYETVIIGGPCDGQLWPPATGAEAQRDHAEAVLIARGAGAPVGRSAIA